MSLRDVNLNLIPILQSLLHHQSVTDAAAALGVSQSAASDSLGKLRGLLKDRLLIREGGRMVLTRQGHALKEPVDALCKGLESFYRMPRWDPRSLNRTFIIATSDYCIFLMAQKLLSVMRIHAPHIRFRFVDEEMDLAAKLATRNIDFAIIPSFFVDDFSPLPIRFLPLRKEVAVVLFRKGHILESKTQLAHADLELFRAIAFQPSANFLAKKRLNIYTAGQAFDVAATVTQVTLIPQMLEGTDYFTIVPRTLAQRMSQILPLAFRELAFTTPAVQFGLAWGPVHDSDIAHQWVRKMAKEALRV